MNEYTEPGQDVIKTLICQAEKMYRQSYAPYSRFHVGAALLAADGRIFSGCNVENASYPCCTCAERTAFAKAVSEGARNFTAIAIIGGPEGGERQYCPPCGVCRQVMSEFCTGAFRIYLAKTESDYEVYTLDTLMPMRFTPENLREIRGKEGPDI